MKKTIGKKFVALLVILALTAGVATASTGTKTLTANYNNIKITIDGQTVTPKNASGETVEPFIVDGTTYLPVRAVAEALGKEVAWDAATSTVVITTPEIEFEDDFYILYKDGSFQPISLVTEYLNDTYSELTTSMGSTNFDIQIFVNKDTNLPYDLHLFVAVDKEFFDEINGSSVYSQHSAYEKSQTKQELRNHMERMARKVIEEFPTNKWYGDYVNMWYDDPSDTSTSQLETVCGWRNYYQPADTFQYPYDQAYITQFTWHPFLDLPSWK